MRIRAVTTAVVNATSHTNWIFVFVETDRGLTGVGEATLIGYEDAVVEAVARIESALAGQDPLGAVPLVRPGDGSQVAAAAHAGVEQALWDLRGKAYGVPVFHLLGRPARGGARVREHQPGDARPIARGVRGAGGAGGRGRLPRGQVRAVRWLSLVGVERADGSHRRRRREGGGDPAGRRAGHRRAGGLSLALRRRDRGRVGGASRCRTWAGTRPPCRS